MYNLLESNPEHLVYKETNKTSHAPVTLTLFNVPLLNVGSVLRTQIGSTSAAGYLDSFSRVLLSFVGSETM